MHATHCGGPRFLTVFQQITNIVKLTTSVTTYISTLLVHYSNITQYPISAFLDHVTWTNCLLGRYLCLASLCFKLLRTQRGTGLPTSKRLTSFFLWTSPTMYSVVNVWTITCRSEFKESLRNPITILTRASSACCLTCSYCSTILLCRQAIWSDGNSIQDSGARPSR